MKKLFVLLLAAMLLCGAIALAEPVVVFEDENVSFDVTMIVPEGYAAEQAQAGRYLHIHLKPEDAAKAEYSVSVAYSELSGGQTINDMSEEDVDTILAFVSQDFEGPFISDTLTKEGTKVYVIDETVGESDYVTAVTLYKGHFVTVEIYKADFSALTQADLDQAIAVLGDMHIAEK